MLLLLAALVLFVRLRYGGGSTDFPERIGKPLLGGEALEEVASLPGPPGNVAVSADGRVFLSIHPEGHPRVKMVELVGGEARPFPDASWQAPRGEDADDKPLPFFDAVLGVRIDRQGRLWTLDHANHGIGQPRLLAFDVKSGTLAQRYDFPRSLTPRGSFLNDLQVSDDGRYVFIADSSIFGLDPALLIVDTASGHTRRVLAGHRSMQAEPYIPVVGGRKMRVFGIFTVKPGVDSIALDNHGNLAFAAVTARRMYRARVADLVDERLAPAALAARVEDFGDKPMTDGMSSDADGNLVLTDPGHDALQLLAPDGTLTTLARDPRLRWPDGLSFGPCGAASAGAECLYVTCSALHQVIGRTPGQIRRAGPYQVFQLRMPNPGYAGH
ncbi:MAG TPA: L-dopachrome tautomerase-related protein [Thermoanaerobaculia bacterium]|nr:L-dopachrome tautomerase-related protein [Thermoanaerobaculia bacterium]